MYRHNLEDRACPFIICQQKTRKLTKVKVSLFHHVDLDYSPYRPAKIGFYLFYTFTLHFRIPTSAPTPTRQATTDHKEHDQEHAPANDFTFHRRGFGQCRQLRFWHLGVLFIFCKIITVWPNGSVTNIFSVKILLSVLACLF